MGWTWQDIDPFYSDEEVSPEAWLGPRALEQWYAEQAMTGSPIVTIRLLLAEPS